jgi:Family of unknown function (DUF5681)
MKGRKNRKGKIGEYDIGYGKTPTYSRYPKGKSGNPGGRPTKQRKLEEMTKSSSPSEIDEMIRAQLTRVITVNEGGKAKKMKMREVISQAQINAAAKGNVHAQKEVMRTDRQIEARDIERTLVAAEQQKAKREEEIETYKLMANYKKRREDVWAEAEARGTEPYDPWPHPDDIMLFPYEQRWKPRGPFDARDLAPFNWYRAERDYLFAYGILDSRQRKTRSRAWQEMYTFLWVSYDVMLPKRWQLVGNMEAEFFKLHFLPMKELEKLVDERKHESDFRKALAGVSDEWDKESYKTVNSIMKPLLKRQGYRSLREFEHAFETEGEKMPWPKPKAVKTA